MSESCSIRGNGSGVSVCKCCVSHVQSQEMGQVPMSVNTVSESSSITRNGSSVSDCKHCASGSIQGEVISKLESIQAEAMGQVSESVNAVC